ncbi:MAG: hypothetical protein LBL67_04915 [Coriobacteriales bacterium]|jgi:hypothetical protein|nr:hypothetical protein [Coriobacteriales bacterium]
MAQAEAAELAQAPTAAKPQLSAKRIRALKKAQARAKAKAAYIKKVEKYLKKRWKGRRLYKYCRQIAEHTWKYRVSYHELARIAIAESGGGARVGYCRSHNNPFGWLDHRHYPTLLKGTKATITRMYYRGRKNEKNWNPVSVAESYAYF